jgi:hypothetical protein
LGRHSLARDHPCEPALTRIASHISFPAAQNRKNVPAL